MGLPRQHPVHIGNWDGEADDQLPEQRMLAQESLQWRSGTMAGDPEVSIVVAADVVGISW